MIKSPCDECTNSKCRWNSCERWRMWFRMTWKNIQRMFDNCGKCGIINTSEGLAEPPQLNKPTDTSCIRGRHL